MHTQKGIRELLRYIIQFIWPKWHSKIYRENKNNEL